MGLSDEKVCISAYLYENYKYNAYFFDGTYQKVVQYITDAYTGRTRLNIQYISTRNTSLRTLRTKRCALNSSTPCIYQ